MLFFALWPNGGGHRSYDAGLQFLRRYPLVCAEIRQLAALGVQRSGYAPKGLGLGLQQVPLYSHATYRREEVLAALGYFALGTPPDPGRLLEEPFTLKQLLELHEAVAKEPLMRDTLRRRWSRSLRVPG